MTTKKAVTAGGRKLTPKQEAFCLAYIETGNASEAYRQAYSTSRMKPETVNNKAYGLLKKGEIGARIEQLREPVRKKAMLTLESHLARLEELSLAAEEQGNYNAAITAETNRGRAAGLYTEKVDHTSSDGSMSPKGRTLDDFYEDINKQAE